MTTRRHFLQWAGAGAAISLAARNGFFQDSTSAAEEQPTDDAKRTYELGLASYTLREHSLDETLAITERVGLKHICLHPEFHFPIASTPEQIAEILEKVKAAGLDLYGSGVVYMAKPDDVNRAFDFAKAAGLRVIVAMPTPDLLPLINEKVKEHDIRLAIHNHGPGDKFYPTPGIAYQKIKDLDPRVGLCIDIGHTLRSGVDPSQAAEQCADRLHDVHMKDIDVAAAAGHCVEAGRGVIDIPRFLRTLDKIGYSGIVSFEYEKDPSDAAPGLAESVGYVRGVLAVI